MDWVLMSCEVSSSLYLSYELSSYRFIPPFNSEYHTIYHLFHVVFFLLDRYNDDNSDDYDYEVYEEFYDDDYEDVDDGNDANDDADNIDDYILSVIIIVPYNLHEWTLIINVLTILQLLTIVLLASKVQS